MGSKNEDGRPATPYGSARDLPSYREMREQLRGMGMLTRFVARQQRPELLRLTKQVADLADLVDRFYACLGERNWIFPGSLSVDDLRAILDRAESSTAAEEELIALYRAEGQLEFLAMRLRHRDGWRPRSHQIDRALEHYRAEQYDSCVLHLIAVMDGFVNDFAPGERKGLAAREPDAMVAWDSVVGHHLGLTYALRSFHRTFKRRVDEEVYEVHRHAIVHGTVTHFDNVVVATKAWNMLSAVSEWAEATKASARPKDPPPKLGEVASLLRRQAKDQNHRDRFEPWSLEAGVPAFAEAEVVQRASAFLEAWRRERWGLLVDGISPEILRLRKSPGEQAQWAKSIYEFHPLKDFALTSVEFPEASVAVIHGSATIGERSGEMHLRWIHTRPDGTLARPDDEGAEWFIGVYAPHTFITGG